MRSRSLTELRHNAVNKFGENDMDVNDEYVPMNRGDDCGGAACWLVYENHDAVLGHLASTSARHSHQHPPPNNKPSSSSTCNEWYASESPLKFTGPKVGRPLRRSNSLYSSYSNLVEHLLFQQSPPAGTNEESRQVMGEEAVLVRDGSRDTPPRLPVRFSRVDSVRFQAAKTASYGSPMSKFKSTTVSDVWTIIRNIENLNER
jgi:hypothetical protein